MPTIAKKTPVFIKVKVVPVKRELLKFLPTVAGQIPLDGPNKYTLICRFPANQIPHGEKLCPSGDLVLAVNDATEPVLWRNAILHLRPDVYNSLDQCYAF